MGRRTPRRTGERTPARRPAGRPPVVADEDRVTRMLDAVSAGVPLTQACLHAGISERAHFRAMEAGEAAEDAHDHGETLDDRAEAYRQYRQRIMRARAAVAVVHVALIGKAARGGQLTRETTRRLRDGSVETERQWSPPEWKASAWLLSKSFPADLGDRRAVEVSGPDGGPVQHAGPGEEALRTLADRLAEVAERQRGQLPGGWDRPALPSRDVPRVIEGNVDDAEGAR
jgi:hypothetical protein